MAARGETASTTTRSGSTRRRTSGARASTSHDAVVMLREDHREVEQVFKAFERSGDGALKAKRRLVDQMIALLSQHAAIEEQVLYPAARAEVSDSESEVLESLEEHHVVKWELDELDGLDPSDERFDAKVTVLMENVRHHVSEEEGELFPLLRAELGRKRLVELGTELTAAKRRAPARPHPRSPDEPPGNLVAGSLAGMVDNVVDKAHDLVKSVRPGT